MSGQAFDVERAALVTGASTGIGLAVAQRLRRDGYALGFHTHGDDAENRARFEEVTGGEGVWVAADLSDPDAASRLVDEVVSGLGRLDVLVNNAGISLAKPALELTAEDFDAVFAVDVRAAFLLSVAAAEPMRRQGNGAIVNVTSVHEHVPRPGLALYSAAKAALGMLTRSLALELAPEIRVNAVAPGAIATERNVEADSLSDEIPLGRPGTPEEVAAVVAFLAGDESAYVSGASVVVDGALIQQVVRQPAG
jgi:NAD(P)-dependent dehydrogenase (short-subunit alcohol dehydrogenase family)